VENSRVEVRELAPGKGPTAYRDPGCPKPLLSSLKTAGQVVPLLAAKRGDGLVLVSGHRRCQGMARLGWDKADIRIVDAPSDLDALKVSVLENGTGPGFSDLERARIVNQLLEVYSLTVENVAHEWLPLLALPPTMKLVDSYAFLGRETILHDGLRTGAITPGLTKPLCRFKGSELRLLAPLLRSISLSFSEKKELLYLLEEIQRRDGVPLEELVKDKQGGDLLAGLRRTRFPERAKRQDHLNKLNSETPRWLGFRPNPAEGLEVRFVFRGFGEFRERAESISRLTMMSEFEEIVDRF
jgi:hypothetical protein